MATVNVGIHCLFCKNLKVVRNVMVGSESTGGGPEPSYKCEYYNPAYFYHNPNKGCDKYESETEEEEY